MINITRAASGALSGLYPFCYDGRTRKVQVDICTELARMKPRGGVIDGQVVSNADLARLKDKGEIQLK